MGMEMVTCRPARLPSSSIPKRGMTAQWPLPVVQAVTSIMRTMIIMLILNLMTSSITIQCLLTNIITPMITTSTMPIMNIQVRRAPHPWPVSLLPASHARTLPDRQHATCNMRYATCNMQHATCNMQRATCNVQHATLGRSGSRSCILRQATAESTRHKDYL